MTGVASFLSPNGRLKPQPFIYGAAAVYLLFVASHLLAAEDVASRAGLWPFAVAQAVLIWIWFALHAGRLHDGGRTSGIAAGASVLYALSVVLLVIVSVGILNNPMSNPNAGAALNLLVIAYAIAGLRDSLQYDFVWAVIAVFAALAFLPVIIAFAVTVWAATRPSIDGG